mmetsp:Transcript_17768/g.27486  ORF Transcript_17768/g.27486 Transcript_17768/m.27486 type:complete len:90 (+) Transcript_17768:3420-3689(+)
MDTIFLIKILVVSINNFMDDSPVLNLLLPGLLLYLLLLSRHEGLIFKLVDLIDQVSFLLWEVVCRVLGLHELLLKPLSPGVHSISDGPG